MTDSVAVVIPCRNGESTLDACLSAVKDQMQESDEIIVVDDASNDRTDEIACRHGVRIITLPHAQGAAVARNVGAAATSGTILFFLDSDVQLHAGAIAAAREILAEGEEVAVHGNLADSTPHRNLVSQYKNHYMHWMFARTRQYLTNFFTSCSAVRRAEFADVGGFNESLRGAVVEDREFGYRLTRSGQMIRFDSRVVGTHHKRYSWRSFIVCEYLRARDITQMALEIKQDRRGQWHHHIPFGFRFGPVLIVSAAASLAGSLWTPYVPWWLPILFLTAIPILNLPFLRHICLKKGAFEAIGGALLIVFDLSVVTIGILAGLFNHLLRRRRLIKPIQQE